MHSAIAIERRRRLRAAAFDTAALLIALTGALAIALLWLLLRTRAGRFDAGEGDSVLAASLIAAATPVWAAWMTLSVRRSGATPGQRRRALAVLAAPRAQADRYAPAGARYVRLALHPLATAAWLWLALVALVAGLPWLPLALAVIAVIVALGGVISLAMLLLQPRGTLLLHDRIAGTQLVSLS